MFVGRANFGTEAINFSTSAKTRAPQPKSSLLSGTTLIFQRPFSSLLKTKKMAEPKVVSPDKLCDGSARGSNVGLLCESSYLSGIKLLLNFLSVLSTILDAFVKGKYKKV
jgi:hypothetical protein